MMGTYVFTYGTDGMDYGGGWTTIHADDIDMAVEAFRLYHPNREGSTCINCAGIYSEEHFKTTKMFKQGENFGAGCREVITLTREIV